MTTWSLMNIFRFLIAARPMLDKHVTDTRDSNLYIYKISYDSDTSKLP